jgi:hypothetical protein
MKPRLANCPACGGPIEFQLSTALVTVCDFCHTVVARGDKSLEDHGKVADLVETDSPVKRGRTGQYSKKNFEVVGRVQYQHPAGGVWDEWYLKFPGDRVRWLAYAQGKYYLTAEKRPDADNPLPSFESLVPGEHVRAPGGTELVVAETGVATARSADGEIPWAFRPNAEHRFVDLHGPGDEFATIEYESTGPVLFLGREVSLEELNLAGDSWEMSPPPSANTTALQINCPHCAGPLTLHAPDQTLRVCCPNCQSLLDCQQGKLEYLQTLNMKLGEKPLIPLGSVGRLFDAEYTVIGFMERYVISEGVKYRWTEYLLSNPTIGFRWLVRSRGHWSFVEPIPVSSVKEYSDHARYQNERFRLFDRGVAHVQYVAGEFYWRVTVGEEVNGADYIAPPRMVSFERSTTEGGSELNVSLARYVTKEEIETAFGLKDLPSPWGVGAIQPAPERSWDILIIWGLCLATLFGLDYLFSSGKVTPPVDQFHFFVALVVVTAWPLVMWILRRQFEVNRWKESDFSPYQSSSDDD